MLSNSICDIVMWTSSSLSWIQSQRLMCNWTLLYTQWTTNRISEDKLHWIQILVLISCVLWLRRHNKWIKASRQFYVSDSFAFFSISLFFLTLCCTYSHLSGLSLSVISSIDELKTFLQKTGVFLLDKGLDCKMWIISIMTVLPVPDQPHTWQEHRHENHDVII